MSLYEMTSHDEAIQLLDKWLIGKKLPSHLQSEMNWYLYEVDWSESTPTLGEGLWEWLDRHEDDPKAGWLRRADLNFIRQALIETGIAVAFDPATEHPWQYSQTPAERTWFRKDGKRYEFKSWYS